MSHRLRLCLTLLFAFASVSAHAQQGLLPPTAAPAVPAQPAAPPNPANAPSEGPGAAAPQAAAAEEEVAAEAEEEAEEQSFSFGTAPYSLMFNTDEITAMKNVLTSVEVQTSNKPAAAQSNNKQDLVPFLATKAKISGEPVTYPVFYLSSILYNDPADWVVWMEGGRRITPKNNTGDLEVKGISRDAVAFSWKPDYMTQLARRQAEKKFAPVAPIKNRLTTNETVVFNETERSISFTLRPNQSFSTAHMSTFEGKVKPVVLPPIDAMAAPAGGGKLDATAKALLNDMLSEAPEINPSTAAASENAVDQKTVNTLQELLKSQKKFMEVVPRNTPPGKVP